MNVSSILTTNYENKSNWTLGENKPNSNPIAERVKLMQSLYLQRITKKNAAKGYEKTKPNQTQFPKSQKMNANAFLQKDYENETVFKPKKTNPNKPNFFKGQNRLPENPVTPWFTLNWCGTIDRFGNFSYCTKQT